MARGIKFFHYFVEGQNEKTILSSIKGHYIRSGKVSVLNVLQRPIPSAQLMTLGEKTCVILVFDTDVLDSKQIACLVQNIKQLEKSQKVTEILLIPQIKNFQDELVFATSIKSATDFTKSNSTKDFKTDFNCEKDIIAKLKKENFDITKFWARSSSELDELLKKTGFSSKKLRKPEDNDKILKLYPGK